MISLTNYNAFGNTTDSNFATSYQITGREYDANIGMYYYRARWYDSQLGRFISEDPIGFAGGDVNLYGYVGNNPQSYRDPSGNFPVVLLGRYGRPQTFDQALDEIQSYLGLVGLFPGFGEPFDAADGAISLARGNYCDAALSGSSMVPFFGTGAGIVKVGKRLPFTPKQVDELTGRLRNGEDIYVNSVEEARGLLDNMPDLRPGGRQNPEFKDPRGTYRGDLINKHDPYGPRIHPPGIRNDHALNPHYNILFHDGTKASIIIK